GLVDAAVLGDEPEVDRAERCDHTADDAGLLLDLAHRRLLGRLPRLDVALRQRPQQSSLAAEAADDRGCPRGVVDAEPGRRRRGLRRPTALPPRRPPERPRDEDMWRS